MVIHSFASDRPWVAIALKVTFDFKSILSQGAVSSAEATHAPTFSPSFASRLSLTFLGRAVSSSSDEEVI